MPRIGGGPDENARTAFAIITELLDEKIRIFSAIPKSHQNLTCAFRKPPPLHSQ
jgi:hypothetical protein